MEQSSANGTSHNRPAAIRGKKVRARNGTAEIRGQSNPCGVKNSTSEPVSHQMTAVRVKSELKEHLDSIVGRANEKKMGRKIRSEDVLSKALSLITEDHMRQLQYECLRPSDKKTFLFQKFKEQKPQATREDFEDFTMTSEWPRFLKRYGKELNLVT